MKKTIITALITLVAIAGVLWILGSRAVFIDVSPEKTVIAVIESHSAPIEQFNKDIGRAPTTSEGFESLLQPNKEIKEKWKGPYVPSIPLDPWARPFQYQYFDEKEEYVVFSFGADGVLSEDDIGR